jgi:2-oxoglutarate ferredoxin oxidoreductase subunit beta
MGGTCPQFDQKKHDGTPEDAHRHDTGDELAAFKLAGQAWPGAFGVFYENKTRKTKNALERDLVVKAKERTKNAPDLALLQATFAKLR